MLSACCSNSDEALRLLKPFLQGRVPLTGHRHAPTHGSKLTAALVLSGHHEKSKTFHAALLKLLAAATWARCVSANRGGTNALGRSLRSDSMP